VALVTLGGAGACVVTRRDALAVPAPAVRVVDTIGAGDAFMGAFLARWRASGLGRPGLAHLDEVADAVGFACRVAALTCARPGADAPDLRELEQVDRLVTGGEAMPRTLYAEFTVTPGNEARVAEMMRELTVLVRAEPGNLVFEPYTEEAQPNRYFVFEAYADDAAFEAHISADYGARFNAELAALIEEDGSQLTWLGALPPTDR
jgi:quinol monooxygenase YgiN